MPDRLLRVWLLLLLVLSAVGLGWLWIRGTGADVVSPAVVVLAWSPSVAALVGAWWLGRSRLVRVLAAPLRRLSFPGRVWLLAVGLPFAVVLLAHVIYRAGGRTVPWFDGAALLPGLGAVLAGSLGEELGWRGVAQPILQRRTTVFWAAVVVGVIWATWHCWAVASPHGAHDAIRDVGLTYLRLVPTAVIYGWILNASGGSLLAVVVAHAAHNVAVTLLPVPDDAPGLQAMVAFFYLFAATVLCVLARHTLFSPSTQPPPAKRA